MIRIFNPTFEDFKLRDESESRTFSKLFGKLPHLRTSKISTDRNFIRLYDIKKFRLKERPHSLGNLFSISSIFRFDLHIERNFNNSLHNKGIKEMENIFEDLVWKLRRTSKVRSENHGTPGLSPWGRNMNLIFSSC